MEVRELGEFGLIERLTGRLAEAGQGPALRLGIGDDAAVWQHGNRLAIATTDTLVEGVHFRAGWAAWQSLGWKALAVNLSDIAAMGGVPGHALITLGLPPDTPVEALDALYDGLAEAARASGTVIAGGDIVRSPVLMITVALWGRDAPETAGQVLTRASAQPGDLVAVTGSLGSSAAGLALLDGAEGAGSAGQQAALKRAHLRPLPRLAEGRALLAVGVRTAMDVSDGLLDDLGKLCRASGHAAVLAAERVPIDPALAAVFPDQAARFALGGGEDYELLFAAPPTVIDVVQDALITPVTIIGRIDVGEPGQVTMIDSANRPIPYDRGGWDHLRGEF